MKLPPMLLQTWKRNKLMKKMLVITLAAALAAAAQAAAEMKPAVMLQQDGSLWTQTSSGEMKWAKNIPAGTLLAVSDEVPFVAKRPSGSKTVESEFCRAEYDGKSYTVMADRIAFGTAAELRAMAQDAVQYSGANVLEYTSTVVPRHKAVVTGEQRQSGGISFVAVTWFDDVKYVKRSGWVRLDKLASGADDWAALELLAKARTAKDKKVKHAVIADAQTLSLSPYMERLLSIEEYNILKNFSPDDTESLELSTVVETGIPGSYIHIYDIPSTRGNVVGRLFYGSSIQCDLKTKASTTETVSFGNEEQTAESCWYHVKENILEDGTVQWPSGWIFGTIAGISQ